MVTIITTSSPSTKTEQKLSDQLSMSNRHTLPRSRSTPKQSYCQSPVKSPIRSPTPSAWALSPGRVPRHETQVMEKEKHSNGVIGFFKRKNSKQSIVKEKTMHMLRIYSCRLLQWRLVNARRERSASKLYFTTVRKILLAWLRINELRSLVAAKKILIQRCKRNYKLAQILNLQMHFFNDHWELVSRRHQDAITELSRTFDSIHLRLPLCDGAQASSVLLIGSHISKFMQIMLEMENAIKKFYSMTDEIAYTLNELRKTVVQEIEKLEELRRTINKIAAVKLQETSLRANIIQAAKGEF